MQAVIKRTRARALAGVGAGLGEARAATGELALVGSRAAIERPEVEVPATLVGRFRWVIFDMDGTLTEPHQIDFKAIRAALGVPAEEDILAWAQTAPQKALVEEYEVAAMQRGQVRLQPGLVDMLNALRARGIPVAIATRNCLKAVDLFLDAAGLRRDAFDPIITRDEVRVVTEGAAARVEQIAAHKPSPVVVERVLAQWRLAPRSVLFVGDAADDVACAQAAGCAMCLIGEKGAAKQQQEEGIAYVTSLAEVLHVVDRQD